ncbi:hypothetical protein ANAEL_00734 [Anaerolineales bacterium]|jgi:hypothetical protein|nr:hypothetical protein ANAEL_00734 [Anaerolineales bacterium]
MIAPMTYQTTMSRKPSSRPGISSGISRVFAAAVVNRQFCDMLLQDPSIALQKGYLGETFPLSKEEKDLIVSIQANSLSDLAKQINRTLLDIS